MPSAASVTAKAGCEAILEKALAGERLTEAEGLRLLTEAEFPSLGLAARRVADRLHPGGLVTFVVDRNINYSNVCTARCRFCAFHREPGAADAYVLSHDEILAKVDELAAIGGTQVLIQGGLHPDLPFDYYLGMVRAIRERYPQVAVHSFSAPEIQNFARLYGLPVRRVLEELKVAGLASLPGGGAEILVERVRRRVSPRKIGVGEWVEVMEAAAEVGLKATATMMFGHVETPAERVRHLAVIRDLQDRTRAAFADGQGVFRAFIPWSFQSANTRLPVARQATAYEYLRLVAVSRLFLDNVPNLQASWVTQGPHVGQLALAFGCNDMGGTMMEENVVRQAGAGFRMDRDGLVRLIRDAGYVPAQRSTAYEMVRVY